MGQTLNRGKFKWEECHVIHTCCQPCIVVSPSRIWLMGCYLCKRIKMASDTDRFNKHIWLYTIGCFNDWWFGSKEVVLESSVDAPRLAMVAHLIQFPAASHTQTLSTHTLFLLPNQPTIHVYLTSRQSTTSYRVTSVACTLAFGDCTS